MHLQEQERREAFSGLSHRVVEISHASGKGRVGAMGRNVAEETGQCEYILANKEAHTSSVPFEARGWRAWPEWWRSYNMYCRD